MVCSHSLTRVAPGEAAQSRGDGVGSGSKSAQALQTAIKTRVVSTGRRGGPSWTTSAFGETPERRLWACNAKFAGPARRTKRVPISASDEFPQRRAGAIKEALHPRTLASRIVILTNGFANRG